MKEAKLIATPDYCVVVVIRIDYPIRGREIHWQRRESNRQLSFIGSTNLVRFALDLRLDT